MPSPHEQVDPIHSDDVMSLILGRFYFRLTDAGNLIGEYSNYLADRARPESGFRRNFGQTDARSFEGEFDSAWHEVEGGERHAAVLKITEVPGTVGIYKLEWIREDGEDALFVGEGMICGDFLIGDYRSDANLPVQRR